MCSNKEKCQICGSDAEVNISYDIYRKFVRCQTCGRYEFSYGYGLDKFNLNHLGSYLAYNGYSSDYRYFTTMSKEECDTYKTENSDIQREIPVHMSSENVENWYPKTFSEKIDYILLYLNKNTKHIGESVNISLYSLYSILFVDRYDYHGEVGTARNAEAKWNQAQYMLNYLEQNGLIKQEYSDIRIESGVVITLTPQAYARIESLLKDNTNGKKAFVAMQFGDNTKKIREAIRKGISDAGYTPEFIDEVHHNDFITPEILKHIKDSKFVVVDLTYQNNGAYFEEGYAMGLGKPVIQLCRNGEKLHFDIAQKNTIMWDDEDDIPQKLKNRIAATID